MTTPRMFVTLFMAFGIRTAMPMWQRRRSHSRKQAVLTPLRWKKTEGGFGAGRGASESVLTPMRWTKTEGLLNATGGLRRRAKRGHADHTLQLPRRRRLKCRRRESSATPGEPEKDPGAPNWIPSSQTVTILALLHAQRFWNMKISLADNTAREIFSLS